MSSVVALLRNPLRLSMLSNSGRMYNRVLSAYMTDTNPLLATIRIGK